ncbi:MAG: hypothetical protein RLZZ370_618 [Bacteroidota bacterium]|jgi:hypothetical protein
MRFLRFLLFLVFHALGLGTALRAQHSNIPNAGFEDWVFTGTYYEPYYWNTFNLASEFGCSPFVAPDSSPVSGKVAVRISTLACTSTDLQFSDTIAGIITLGERDVSPGLPANQKPAKFSFYLKYQPTPGDSAAIILLFTRNKSIGVKEQVGVAFHVEGRSISNWTRLELPVYWLLPGLPDSVQVVCTSSKAILDGKKPRQPGSVLWLDNLATDQPIWMPSSVTTPQQKVLVIHPNPAGTIEVLQLQLPDAAPFQYRIYDSKSCLKATGTSAHKQLPLQSLGLSPGVYHLEVIQLGRAHSAHFVLIQEP